MKLEVAVNKDKIKEIKEIKKKEDLPKLDLSEYSKSKQINSDIELLLVQALIYYDKDYKKVSNYYVIDQDIVSSILIKYYKSITKLVNTGGQDELIQKSLDKIVDIITAHIKELHEKQKVSKTKMLTPDDSSTLSKMTDRLLRMREENVRVSVDTMNKLTETLIKMKVLELQEKGEIEDTTGLLKNQTTVNSLLKVNTTSVTVPIKAVDVETGGVRIYTTLTKAAKAAGKTRAWFSNEVVGSGEPLNGVLYTRYNKTVDVKPYEEKESQN